MKKIFGIVTLFALVLVLAACGNGSDSEESAEGEAAEISVAASPAPHAEILERAADILAEEDITVNVEIVNDYTTPNSLLADEEVDANFFQHTPYLDGETESHGYDLTSIGNVHIEPMAVYSNDYDSLEDIPDGSTILVSNNPAEEGRFLSFFVNAGLVEIEEGIEIQDATFDDITENPHNFEFDNNTAPELLVSMYENNEAPAVIINANFAIDGGLSPVDDSIAVEEGDSPYANLIAVRAGDEERPELQRLIEVLQSEEMVQFIEEEYDGTIIPAE